MTTYDKIKKLADERKMPIYKVEQAAGISNGVIAGWKSGKPLAETLSKVAKVLDVPIADLIEEAS